MSPVFRALRRSIVAASIVALPAAAFAQSPSSPTHPAVPDRVSPPIPLGGTPLVLAAPFADTIYAANVSVEVDPNGKADLNTLSLSGSAGEYNRKAITEWLRKTTFRPGMRNGLPIRSTFRMTAEALKQADEPADTSHAAPR